MLEDGQKATLSIYPSRLRQLKKEGTFWLDEQTFDPEAITLFSTRSHTNRWGERFDTLTYLYYLPVYARPTGKYKRKKPVPSSYSRKNFKIHIKLANNDLESGWMTQKRKNKPRKLNNKRGSGRKTQNKKWRKKTNNR